MMMMSDREFLKFTEEVVKNYRGDGSKLINALGALSLGRQVGWRVLSLVTSEPTFLRYQKILGVKFKDVLPERGKYAKKSFALRIVDEFDNFWRVVQGRDKMAKDKKFLFDN